MTGARPSFAGLAGTVGQLGWDLSSAFPDAVSTVQLHSWAEAVEKASQMDSVVLSGVLWRDPDTQQINRLAKALRRSGTDSGRLFFCEPTLGLGLAAVGQRFSSAASRLANGHHHRVDIPPVVRQSGMRITTLHRFSIGRPRPLRTFVAGEARWYPEGI